MAKSLYVTWSHTGSELVVLRLCFLCEHTVFMLVTAASESRTASRCQPLSVIAAETIARSTQPGFVFFITLTPRVPITGRAISVRTATATHWALIVHPSVFLLLLFM